MTSLDPLERELRATFAAGAAAAPGPDGLGPAVTAALHDRRRRRLTVAASTAAVLGVVAAAGAVTGLGGDRTPRRHPLPVAAAPDSGASVLRFRGVEVPVPAGWLARTHAVCGEVAADADWVAKDSREGCMAAGPQVTTVLLARYLPPAGLPPTTDTPMVLKDGRTSVSHLVADRGVMVTATSPDPAVATRLVTQVRVLADDARVAGCPVKLPEIKAPDGSPPLLHASAPSGAVVCAYDDAHLGAVTVLATAEAGRIADALNRGGPAHLGIVHCPLIRVGQGAQSWRIDFTGAGTTGITASALCPGSTTGNAVADDGTARTMTAELFKRLITLQPTFSEDTALRTCGTVPRSDGPSRDRIGARLVGPATAVSGSDLQLQAELRSLTGRDERFDSGLPIQLLITRGSDIVGSYRGAVGGVGVSPVVPARGTVTVPEKPGAWGTVLLAGCVSGEPDGMAPDESRASLPPGAYALVGVLEDGATGHLVTEPFPITVTAPDPHAEGRLDGFTAAAGEVELASPDGVVQRSAPVENHGFSLTAPPGTYVLRSKNRPSCAVTVQIEPSRAHRARLECPAS